MKQVTLDPTLQELAGDKAVTARAAGDGPELVIPVPAEFPLTQHGTIGFRLKTSRAIRTHEEGQPLEMTLVDSPYIEVDLAEGAACAQFDVQPAGRTIKGHRRCLISHLKPDKWYHFAVSWDAASGRMCLYINGWAQQHVYATPWTPAAKAAGDIALGGVLGQGAEAATVEIDKPELWAWYMTEAQMRTALEGRDLPETQGEVRKQLTEPLDLSSYKLTTIFEPDFSKPLDIIEEKSLFDGDKRVREPKEGQWVLEGPAEAKTESGHLRLDNLNTEGRSHVILWLPRPFPESFLLEFDTTLEVAGEGLAIVFFAARPVEGGGSIHKPGLPLRDGDFSKYIRGVVRSYHCSYYASMYGQGPRRGANLRKNNHFYLVACGDDHIVEPVSTRGPHHVRILKDKNKIRVETNGKLSVIFDDDGQTYGPVWDDGYIGLRQMNHTLSATYQNLKVYSVEPR